VEQKIIGSWTYRWVKLKNCLDDNEDIWVQRWVKITESDEPVI